MPKKILVIGDIILDHFVYGRVERLNPESPNPLLNIESEEYKLGGAANVAANITSLGGTATLCGKIGEDDGSREIGTLCTKHFVDFHGVRSKSPTTLKHRYIELTYRQQLLRSDWEKIEPLSEPETEEVRKVIEFTKPDIIVLSDYKKWCITSEVARMSLATGAKVIVDSKLQNPSDYRGAYVLKPNFKEFSQMMGIHEPNTDATIEKYGPLFVEKYETNAVITRSEKGASLVETTGIIHHFAPQAREVFDVTGAGDTFIAGLTVATSEGLDLQSAVRFANAASSIAVSRVGTTVVKRSEIA